MTTHHLYLDDSGTKEYAPEGKSYGHNNTRHFVFGGPLLKAAVAEQLAADIGALKLETFGNLEVEIKSNWLRIPQERERRYLRRYGLAEATLNGFVDAYYRTICQADLVLLACVVDKVHMRDEYAEKAWYPPAAAYEVVMQRAQQELGDGNAGAQLRVVVDDMTGATPKGNQYRQNLRAHHRQLKQTGSRLQPGLTFPSLKLDIDFVNSARSHLVQVADVVAYNVYRQFKDYGDAWEDLGLQQLPVYDWFLKICQKFRCGPAGRIQGYGVAKMPLVQRVPWKVNAAGKK